MSELTMEDRKRIKTKLEQDGTIQNCGNCEHWNRSEQKCNKYQAVPPPYIILDGCENWEHYVPF